jgi:hypothetical protein
MIDPDKLFRFYAADGTVTLVTPRELMSRGMTADQIVEAEEYASTHFKPVHDALEAAREAGIPEAQLQEIVASYQQGSDDE